MKQGNGTLDWLETQWGGWMGGGGCQDQQEVKKKDSPSSFSARMERLAWKNMEK